MYEIIYIQTHIHLHMIHTLIYVYIYIESKKKIQVVIDAYFRAENGLIFVQIHFPLAAAFHFFLNCAVIGGAGTTAGVKPPLPNNPNTSRDIPLGLFSRTEVDVFAFEAALFPNEYKRSKHKEREIDINQVNPSIMKWRRYNLS